MKLSWYNRSRQFDNGIVWFRIDKPKHNGWGLWFSRVFPWVWILTPWTCAPDWANRRAQRMRDRRWWAA